MQRVEPLAPPAPWQGGKRRLADHLGRRIAAIPHEIYAEPFIGMGGVFFRRRLRPRLEVINDLGRDVANFFRILQRHPDALIGELARQVPSRAEFERQQGLDPDTLTDVERAARFYYLQRLAYAGKIRGRSFGISLEHEARFDITRLQRRLKALHARMAGVMIECLPYDEFLRRYDRREALFYLDPPYWGGEDDYGKDLFGRRDFDNLAGILAGLAGRFLLSLNDRPEIREIFAAFELEAVETRYTVGSADRAAPAAELIISDGRRDGDGIVEQPRLL